MKKEESKSELTARLLMKHIVDSHLSVGDRLPSEEEMTRMFNVSRVSVREATNGLKFLGVLESAQRRGTTVAKVDFGKLSQYIGFQIAFNTTSYKELLEARIIVESGQLELVAINMTSENIAELKQLAHDTGRDSDSYEDISRSIRADYEFHRQLLAIGGNFALQAFSELLETFFQNMQHGTIADSQRAMQEHLTMVEALSDGNLELARGMMRKHLLHRRVKGNGSAESELMYR